MIRLSSRLQVIAGRMHDIKTMADIGTDHGFLPVFMVQSGACEKAIAADISRPSLEKAEQLCAEYGITSVETRLGDGLGVLQEGEAEGLVIAGMGGLLITEILSKDPELSHSFKRLVLQPRSAAGDLRRWLLANGYIITGEDLVYEGKFIPQIITAVPVENMGPADRDITGGSLPKDRDICFEVPPWICKATGPVEEHLHRITAREQRILEGLRKAGVQGKDKIEITESNIRYLEDLSDRGNQNEGKEY